MNRAIDVSIAKVLTWSSLLHVQNQVVCSGIGCIQVMLCRSSEVQIWDFSQLSFFGNDRATLHKMRSKRQSVCLRLLSFKFH